LREPDHLAPAGERCGAKARPTAAMMARLLSGLSIFALESIAKTSGTISTKARREPDQPFRSHRAGTDLSVRPFFLTQGFPRHQKRLEEILRGHLCPHRKRETNRLYRRLHKNRTALEACSGHCSDPKSLL
jgi:hypothetical protein